jgi:LacI family transcriptional regulator
MLDCRGVETYSEPPPPETDVERIYVLVTGHDYMPSEQLLKGITEFAHERGNWEIVVLPGSFCEVGEGFGASIQARAFSGMLTAVNAFYARELAQLGRPVVNISDTMDVRDLPLVACDDDAVGRMAARHLIDSGSTHFAYCGTAADWSRERERGFTSEVTSRGYECVALAPDGRPEERFAGYEILRGDRVRSWIELLPKPIGIMGCSDEYASHIIEEAYQLGVAIPDEISVVGADDAHLFCEYTRVTLSSIDRNISGRGYVAAQLLARMLEGEPAPVEPVLVGPRRVVARRSTAVVAPNHPRLRQAVEYIRTNACSGIDVADVASAVGLSRTKLHRLFQERLGRPPGEELRKIRLRKVVALLTQSELSLGEVAQQSGFSSVDYMSHAFKRAYGMRLSEYRKRCRGRSAAE